MENWKRSFTWDIFLSFPPSNPEDKPRKAPGAQNTIRITGHDRSGYRHIQTRSTSVPRTTAEAEAGITCSRVAWVTKRVLRQPWQLSKTLS